jgi:hypothetical protein
MKARTEYYVSLKIQLMRSDAFSVWNKAVSPTRLKEVKALRKEKCTT